MRRSSCCRCWASESEQHRQIVPTLCVGMPQRTLRVLRWDAERPGMHSHAERGNDQRGGDQVPAINCRAAWL
ncbi:hypothetical protein CT157_03540 [Pseudomonas syringae]|uniref:Uncharacterized protein n=1 Tax=Pseudomonas syringae TaxID=317 RepID=A0A3T0JNX2_PSESX|nr:hypothetical protein CT157_03540 [Pseudomonas syringae]